MLEINGDVMLKAKEKFHILRIKPKFKFLEALGNIMLSTKPNTFLRGITDSIPIFLGYLSVSFAFGIFATESGLSVAECVLISMTNVTSAGQLAAVPIIAGGGSLIELASTQFIINLRYALMSVSLSQKLHSNIRVADRFAIAFVNTDETFAVSTSNKGEVKRNYMYGLIVLPYFGWAFGTMIGALAGNILPPSVSSALGVAIYAMFVAIVIPEVKHRKGTALCVLFASVLSCVFHFAPYLSKLPEGFMMIICAVAASIIFAIIYPIEGRETNTNG